MLRMVILVPVRRVRHHAGTRSGQVGIGSENGGGVAQYLSRGQHSRSARPPNLFGQRTGHSGARGNSVRRCDRALSARLHERCKTGNIVGESLDVEAAVVRKTAHARAER